MINEGKRMELGSQIKRHRTERGLSQDDLAAKIYVSRQTVSSWENDKTYPDVESLLLLSVLFDVTVDELIKGDVEAMKEAISNDYKKMMALATGGLIIALSGAAAFLGGIFFWDWGIVPSSIIGLLIWGHGMAMLVVVERIKKQHDLVTYRELVAFSKGEPSTATIRAANAPAGIACCAAWRTPWREQLSAPSPATSDLCSSSGSAQHERFSISRRHGLLTAYIYN